MKCFLQNKETWNLGPKMPYLLVFRQEFFEKTIVTLKCAPLDLPKWKVLDKINNSNKTNCDQTCLIWVFRQEFDKTIGIVYFKLTPSNFSKCKVSCKTKEISNLSPKVQYSGIFRLTFEKAIVIFEINTFEFLKSEKVMQNKETSNLEPKLLIWVFLGCNFKIVLLQYLKPVFLNFPKNGFLTSAGNFDVGSTFYEGPESTFSESVDLGLGPLN